MVRMERIISHTLDHRLSDAELTHSSVICLKVITREQPKMSAIRKSQVP